MSTKYNQNFKSMIVEKALSRGEGVTMSDIAEAHGVSIPSIRRWILAAQQTDIEPAETMTEKEKRPQDWTLAERLQAIIDCDKLSENERSAYCRKRGLYPHHIKQWKENMTTGATDVTAQSGRSHLKQLKEENKRLKQELQRKEKALAETAALLVLKKKVQHLLEGGEEN